MNKTIEATWREGFLNPDALVAPKVNDFYTRKSTHIVDRIQRMQRINEIAIVIGAPIVWAILSALGMPYGGGDHLCGLGGTDRRPATVSTHHQVRRANQCRHLSVSQGVPAVVQEPSRVGAALSAASLSPDVHRNRDRNVGIAGWPAGDPHHRREQSRHSSRLWRPADPDRGCCGDRDRGGTAWWRHLRLRCKDVSQQCSGKWTRWLPRWKS